MDTKRTYAVIGSGAIGSYFGTQLDRANFGVHYHVRSDYEQVKAHGFHYRSIDGDYTVAKPHIYKHIEDLPICDVVLIALKGNKLDGIKTALHTIIDVNTIIVILQNGLGLEEIYAKQFPNNRIIGGACWIKSTRVSPGNFKYDGGGQLILAQYAEDYADMGITEAMQAIGKDFQDANIKIKYEQSLAGVRWNKFCVNVPNFILGILLNMTTNEINTTALPIAAMIRAEVEKVARAYGVQIDMDQVNVIAEKIRSMPPFYNSMKNDFDSKKELELDITLKSFLKLAAVKQIDAPIVTYSYKMLSYLDQKNRGLSV